MPGRFKSILLVIGFVALGLSPYLLPAIITGAMFIIDPPPSVKDREETRRQRAEWQERYERRIIEKCEILLSEPRPASSYTGNMPTNESDRALRLVWHQDCLANLGASGAAVITWSEGEEQEVYFFKAEGDASSDWMISDPIHYQKKYENLTGKQEP